MLHLLLNSKNAADTQFNEPMHFLFSLSILQMEYAYLS